MRIITYLLVLGAMIIVQGCKEDDTFDLNVNVKLVYDGEPLVMFEDYEYPTGEKMSFSRYSFYLTNVALNHSIGQDQIKDAEYLNFTNQNVDKAGAEQGLTLTFRDIDKKDYDQMFFMVGVDATNNAKTPSDFNSSNPLSRTGEYWPGWQSYVFTKTEGQIDLGGTERRGFSLHTGGDEANLGFLVQTPNLGDNSSETVELVIDIKKTFDNNGTIYDIQNNPDIHNTDQKDLVAELVNNLRFALSGRLR